MALAAGITALGSIGASFLSNATSKGAQARAYNYARQLQQQQYDLSIKGYREAPGAQREGLISAGYNPMLALGNVGSGVNVAGGTPVNANATDVSGMKEAASTAVQLQNQTKQTDASTDQMYAEADKAKAEKATIVERLPYVSKQAKADYLKTTMESAKLENDIHYQNEYLNYLENSLSNAVRIAEIQSAAQKYGADKLFKGTIYNADTQAKSTPFRYITDKFEKSGLSPYNLGKSIGESFARGLIHR